MGMLNRLFNKNKYDRRCYAITHGKYKGCFFVYMHHDEEKFCFLSLPENEPVDVPADVFLQGLKSKIVDHIEKLPYNVYEICKAQYNETKSKNIVDRLKQSAASSGVDSGECEKKR